MQRTVYKINPMPVSYLMKFIKKIKKVAKESNMKIVSWIEESEFSNGEYGQILYWYTTPAGKGYSRKRFIEGGYPNIITTIILEEKG